MEVILPTDTDEDETESACLPSEDQDWQDPATYPSTDTGHTGYTGLTGFSSVSQVFDKVRQGEVAGAGEGENTQLSLVKTF